MTTRPKIRPATREDVIDFYGKAEWMFRAYVAEHDDRLLAIAGIYFDENRTVLFSDVRPEMYDFRISIGYLIREVRKLMVGRTNLYASAENEEPEKTWLIRKLGFEHVEGRFWRWQSSDSPETPRPA